MQNQPGTDSGDFVRRYERGAPWDDISDDEARSNYDSVSGRMSDDDYEMSAEEAFTRLSPHERKRLGRMMREGGRKRKVDFDDVDDDDENPKTLAKMARKTKKKDPGLLGSLLGGGGGGGEGPLGKAVLGGIAASAFKKIM
jgi:hypothetical protein